MKALNCITLQLEPQGLRRQMWEGQETLIAPVVLLVEGVHAGSAGARFYPAAELEASAHLWNGISLPVFHPQEDGDPVSANDPTLIEAQSAGRLFNVVFDEDGNRLRGELWIQIKKAQEIAPQIIPTIERGGRLEVSTGLFWDEDGTAGVWEGEEFQATVSNYRPDHLALLPGMEGACSWDDGCGVRNQRLGSDNGRRDAMDNVRAALTTIGNALGLGGDKPPEKVGAVMLCQQGAAKNSAGEPCRVVRIHLTGNEMSHGDVQRKLQAAIDSLDGNGWVHYIRDVFDDFVVFEASGADPGQTRQSKLYKQAYGVDSDNAVTLAGEPAEVVEERSFVAVSSANADGAAGPGPEQKEEGKMNKGEMIAVLIANERSPFEAEDTKALEVLEEERIKGLVDEFEKEPETPPAADPPAEAEGGDSTTAVAEEEKETEVTKEEEKPVTMEQYMEKAPADFRDTLKRLHARGQREKAEIIKALAANDRCTFTAEQLQAKDFGELEQLAELARVEVDYSGSGGGAEPEGDAIPSPPNVFEVKRA